MITYISILRGINVSGQKLIKMDALRKSYETAGFLSVQTYIQSGNVIFKSDLTNQKEVKEKITNLIRQNFGFDVPVIVLSVGQLKERIAGNPFLQQPDKNTDYMHVTFLAETTEGYDTSIIASKKATGEVIAFSNEAIYLYCPAGYGKTKLTNHLIESKLKVSATTRNWKTTTELLRIAERINN